MSLGCGVQASLGMRYVCQPWFKVFGRSFAVSCGEFSVCNRWKSLLHIQLNIKEWYMYMYMYIILINLVQVPYCNLPTKFCPFRFIALMHQKSKPLPPPPKKKKLRLSEHAHTELNFFKMHHFKVSFPNILSKITLQINIENHLKVRHKHYIRLAPRLPK